MTIDDLVQSADQWAKENLDDDALRILQEVDRDKVKRFFSDIQKRLGPIRDALAPTDFPKTPDTIVFEVQFPKEAPGL